MHRFLVQTRLNFEFEQRPLSQGLQMRLMRLMLPIAALFEGRWLMRQCCLVGRAKMGVVIFKGDPVRGTRWWA
jgi:hypothetical protein